MSAGLWYINLVRRVPVPAAWVGASLVTVSWAVTALLGLDFTAGRFEARVPYVLGAAIGYLVAVTPYAIRKAQEDLDSLRGPSGRATKRASPRCGRASPGCRRGSLGRRSSPPFPWRWSSRRARSGV